MKGLPNLTPGDCFPFEGQATSPRSITRTSQYVVSDLFKVMLFENREEDITSLAHNYFK